MNLHELHTPHPLRDSDFAAIRARVKAEIAPRTSWMAILARLAFAAALLVVFVPLTSERKSDVPVQVIHRVVAEQPPLSSRASSEGPGRAVRQARASRASRPARPAPSLIARDDKTASRIEIHTEDPTIRIIWLTPKENS